MRTCRRALGEAVSKAILEGDDAVDGIFNAELSPTPSALTSTESFWDSIRESATTRVVLPAGEEDLQRAANRFLATLTSEQWNQLDLALQDQVLAMRGGLFRACMGTNDLIRAPSRAIRSWCRPRASYLSNLLPVTDVAEVEMGIGMEELAEGNLPTRIRELPRERPAARGPRGPQEGGAAPAFASRSPPASTRNR